MKKFNPSTKKRIAICGTLIAAMFSQACQESKSAAGIEPKSEGASATIEYDKMSRWSDEKLLRHLSRSTATYDTSFLSSRSTKNRLAEAKAFLEKCHYNIQPSTPSERATIREIIAIDIDKDGNLHGKEPKSGTKLALMLKKEGDGGARRVSEIVAEIQKTDPKDFTDRKVPSGSGPLDVLVEENTILIFVLMDKNWERSGDGFALKSLVAQGQYSPFKPPIKRTKKIISVAYVFSDDADHLECNYSYNLHVEVTDGTQPVMDIIIDPVIINDGNPPSP